MTYDRVNWQNEPSENTPISAENLNKMDSAIKTLSEMVEANPVEADTDELKKIGIEGTIYKIAGGHELVNSSGSTMTQRSKMEFLDTHLTDDSVNNTTKVEVVKEVTTAQFANETERGLYRITDKPDSVINAEQVAYGSGNVKTALDNAFKSFDDWTLLSDFDTNNDTWIATDDGFLSVRATNVGATNGTYCYLYDTGLSSSVPISTIALPSGGGSLTYAQVIPVIKGHTYKMLMGGAISSVASYFLKINK